jgi:hypothetical protein
MKPHSCIAAILPLLIAAAIPCRAQVICSGDIPPQGTVVTATGTSSICGGSCRARRFEPVWGTTMVICAQQPIPKHYVLESVTSSPLCRCLGGQDNAYVIRFNPPEATEEGGEPQQPWASPTPMPPASGNRWPQAGPPFGAPQGPTWPPPGASVPPNGAYGAYAPWPYGPAQQGPYATPWGEPYNSLPYGGTQQVPFQVGD